MCCYIVTSNGKLIDITAWLDKMRENQRLHKNIFEQTPIGITADKNYFWWDEDTNPVLTKQSIKSLTASLCL